MNLFFRCPFWTNKTPVVFDPSNRARVSSVSGFKGHPHWSRQELKPAKAGAVQLVGVVGVAYGVLRSLREA